MKAISVLAISFLAVVCLFVFSAHATATHEGTYVGSYLPDGMGASYQDMVLSLGLEDGYATFYNINKGVRKAAPIAEIKPGDDEKSLVLHVLYSSSGEKRDATYNVKLAGDTITGSAFGGTINLKRVDLKACPVDRETKKITAPC